MDRLFSRAVALLAACTLAACSDANTPLAPTPTAPPTDRPSAAISTLLSESSDGLGTAWRQLTETPGISWNQAAALCPRDGVNPCEGSVGAVSLSGWVWATDAQVVELIARYAPAIRTTSRVVGAEADQGVSQFFTVFTPLTTGGCSGSGYIFTCSFGLFGSGWTATSTAPGSALQATLQSGFGSPSFIELASNTTIATVGQLRGLFMWRADGSGGTGIVANDDAGSVESYVGGIAVANVLVNDSLKNSPATLATVTVRQLTTSHAGVALNVATGAVTVDSTVPVGARTLTYRICETVRPSNCDTAIVSVSVTGNLVDAVDDAGAAKTGGGVAVANVLANDMIGGATATLSKLNLTQLTGAPLLAVQTDGRVTVPPATPVGTYVATYRICEIGKPTNCDDATIRVSVSAYLIDAVDDAGSVPAARGGLAVANVLGNDRFDTGSASLATVTLTQISSSTPGLTLDASTGALRAAAGMTGTMQSLRYRICERASAINCDSATVSVTVVPQGYIYSSDRLKVVEGKSGSFTVRLSQQPLAAVAVSVAYLGGTMPVTSGPGALTFTVDNWNIPQTVTFSTLRDSDKIDNAGTLVLNSAGIAASHVVVSGMDGDRKGTDPVAVLQSPYNGQTVTGMVSFAGTASDADGTVIDAKFSIDANRLSTVTASGGVFRAPAWNSATVANGWHTLEMRVTDNAGNDGRATISIFVQN
jgi:hypothetical protein